MHDFYVNQLHHHSPHATMHTIHAIYFFSGLSRSWWSRGAASVMAHGKDKEIIKTIPFFLLLSYFCRNCIQIIPKEYPAKTHIFESPAFSFAFMHKWKVRLMPAFFWAFFQMHNFRFWKCSADSSIAHPHPTFSSRASFFQRQAARDIALI